MKILISLLILINAHTAKADLFGGDLPLLAQIVTNTLQTLFQLERQTSMMSDEMAGIKDKIQRIQTIADMVQPSTWDQWKDPRQAVERLRVIYHTLPKEYHSEKSDAIEEEIARAMNMISKVSGGAQSSFQSGKELERKGADSSPGVAQKLTASGVGSLVVMEAQTQIIQSHMTSLLAQMLADANERENRSVLSKGTRFTEISEGFGAPDDRFSRQALKQRTPQ